jgi:DNA-binding MarR family transcriptional regulator
MKIEEEIKSRFENEQHKVLVNLLYTTNALNQVLTARFKLFGLAPQQYNVLRILKGQFPKSASIGLIKDRMLDKNSDASRIVERLFKKDFVERKESLLDRRQKEVLITSKGISVLEKIDGYEKQQDMVFANLTKEDAVQLNVLLDKARMEL